MSTGTLSLGWVSDALKMVCNRNQQQNGVEGNESYWLAWEAGKTLEQMERVIAKTLQYMNNDGILDTKQIWVDLTNENRRWDPIRQKFVDRLTGNVL